MKCVSMSSLSPPRANLLVVPAAAAAFRTRRRIRILGTHPPALDDLLARHAYAEAWSFLALATVEAAERWEDVHGERADEARPGADDDRRDDAVDSSGSLANGWWAEGASAIKVAGETPSVLRPAAPATPP